MKSKAPLLIALDFLVLWAMPIAVKSFFEKDEKRSIRRGNEFSRQNKSVRSTGKITRK